MGCDKYIEWISAALDGELTAEERRELDGHLAACPDCAALFEALGGQSRALRELEVDFPADLHARIMNHLPPQESPAKKNKVIRWKRWSGLAACLVLVAAAALAAPSAFRMGSMAPAAETANHLEAPQQYAGGPKDGAKSDSSLGSFVTESEYKLCDDNMEIITFSRAHNQRVGFGCEELNCPSATGVSSAGSLNAYLNAIPASDPVVEGLREAYPNQFFTGRSLVLVLVREGSGSISHEVLSVTGDTVTVRRIVPEAGTCDMAEWLLVVELDCVLDDGSTLTVEFTN